MEKMGVLPRFKGVMVHDFWKSYFKFKKCKHAMCNVHILRELNEIYKDNAQEWAIDVLFKLNGEFSNSKNMPQL